MSLEIKGLGNKTYYSREFKIDSKNANFLTALWRAGSPDQPTGKQMEEIMRGARLAPLPPSEKALPEFIDADSLSVKAVMEDDSIYVIELMP